MKAFPLPALLALLPTLALAQDQPQVARLSESDALFASIDTAKLKKADCQPLRGDRVSVLGWTQAMQTQIAHVRVLDGHCQGAEGWVGAAKLEAAH